MSPPPSSFHSLPSSSTIKPELLHKPPLLRPSVLRALLTHNFISVLHPSLSSVVPGTQWQANQSLYHEWDFMSHFVTVNVLTNKENLIVAWPLGKH